MNTKQLENRLVSIEKVGYGHWRITQRFRGKIRTHVTTNAPAIDRYTDKGEYSEKIIRFFYTYKQALKAILNK